MFAEMLVRLPLFYQGMIAVNSSYPNCNIVLFGN